MASPLTLPVLIISGALCVALEHVRRKLLGQQDREVEIVVMHVDLEDARSQDAVNRCRTLNSWI